MKRFGFLSGLAVLALAIHAIPAAAGVIVNADVATTSGNPGVAGTNIGFIIDGSGLSATVTDANFATVTHSVGFAPATDRWIDNTTTTVSNITFTFNSPVTLDQVLIWNGTQTGCCNLQGIDLFNIQVDTGGGFGGTVFSADINSSTHVLATHTAQVLNIGTQSGIVGLRFDTVTNQGYGFGIGLDEVVFRNSVPEPSGLVIFSIMGVMGLVVRRRRRR